MPNFARRSIKSLSVFTTLALVTAFGRPAVALPHHPMLDNFQAVFVRTNYGGQVLPLDSHGNKMSGHTVLLPTPGDGTGAPASVDVALDSDEPFFLPLFQLLGTSYTDGTPSDRLVNFNVFKTLEITFTVDDRPAVTSTNALDYYTQFYFQYPVKLNSPPIKAIIYLQGIGYIQKPLLPGRHTLKLHVKNTQAAFGGFVEYNNTFNLTVTKPHHH